MPNGYWQDPAPVRLAPALGPTPARQEASTEWLDRVRAQKALAKAQARQNIGVPNPYGAGASAFEPNTEVFAGTGAADKLVSSYSDAYNAVQGDKPQAAAPTSTANDSAASGPTYGATGTPVANIIAAAKTMLGKPYVWGGTTSAGVDCSGLIYYAFNQAGVKMPRYRASDYGTKVGHTVTASDARAGDLVYWDEPGSVDHVGIYLGNGMVIQSPQTGDVTKISRVWGNPVYRRVLDDSNFGMNATPSGPPVQSYGGVPAHTLFTPALAPTNANPFSVHPFTAHPVID